MSSEDFSPLEDLDLSATVRGLRPGQKLLGRYTLKRIIGRGGMGVVWLAFDEVLKEELAFKFLPDMLNANPADLDDLKEETIKSRRLAHPNIIRIYDFVRDEHCAGISMEYIDGDTLSNMRLARPNKIFEVPDLQPLLQQLCAALEYAHEIAEVAHRDLKPANLMVTKRGQLKVADFGISRSVSETMTRVTARQHGASGTLVYMSPQQAMGDAPSVLDDIYSLGATIYELLTSKPPFYTGEVMTQVREKIAPPIAERRKELKLSGEPVPRRWEETIAACLSKDPAKRPQSAREVAELLGDAETDAVKPSRGRRRKTPAPAKPVEPAPDSPAAVNKGPLLTPKTKPLPRKTVPVPRPPAPPPAPPRELKPEPQPTLTPRRSLRLVAISLLVLAALGLAGYYFWDRLFPIEEGVRVVTIPKGAQVFLGEKSLGRAPLVQRLQPGKYQFKFQADLFESKTMEVPVVAGVVTNLTVELERSLGTVAVQSTPTGLEYEIRDKEGVVKIGVTPATNNLPTGNYTVTIRRPNWLPHEQALRVERKSDNTVLADFTPVPLVITSDPPGAEISLDGQILGKTPHTNALPHGKEITLTARYPDLPDKRLAFTLARGQSQAAHFQFDYGSVLITSEPSGALVTLKDSVLPLGKTPLTIPHVPEGKVTYQVQLNGYHAKTITEKVVRGQTSQLPVILQPDIQPKGELLVQTIPPGATVYLEGKAEGQSGTKIFNLSPGRYQLRLEREGYEPVENQTVEVRANEVASPGTFILTPSLAHLQLTTKPGNMDFEVRQGERLVMNGRTPKLVPLSIGTYTVEFKRPSWPATNFSVTLQRNQTNTVTHTFDSGLVTITSDPPGAEIFWNGSTYGKVTDQIMIELPPGAANLSARHSGWNLPERNKTVTVEKGRTNAVNFDFDYGAAIVTSSPPGAWVRLKGFTNILGRTPFTNPVVRVGKLTYELELEGYKPVELSGAVEKRRTTQLEEKLRQRVGGFSVRTLPDKASIVLDGTSRGTSDMTFRDLPVGRHILTVFYKDYEPAEGIEIEIKEDTVNPVGPIQLRRSTGALRINALPVGADYEITGAELKEPRQGKVPFTETELPTGDYSVLIREGAWNTSLPKITVARNATNVTPELRLPYGSVLIWADQPSAQVWQDGKPLGSETPLKLPKLKPGPVAYQLKKPGFKRATVSGVIEPQKELSLSVRLEKQIGPQSGERWTNNTLGMRFVPVGAEGRVLFSIWETRQMDYAKFRDEPSAAWKKTSFLKETTPFDPVVNVSWEEAKSFCDWLTETERGQGKFDRQFYRLPTDAEWSEAVQLKGERGATPAERSESVVGIFPWGTNWPPPAGAGNYDNKFSYDRFDYTAPVGQFRPNVLGIYDLGGNVWEWCEDALGKGQPGRVLRGGSYRITYTPTSLLSSFRDSLAPKERKEDIGFRVVLDVGEK